MRYMKGKICDIERDMLEKQHMPRLCYEMKNNSVKDLDINLCTCNAGKFSVSKINILIGQVLGCIFLLALVSHIVALYFNMFCHNNVRGGLSESFWLGESIIAMILITWGVIYFLCRQVKSSSLKRKKKNNDN